MSSVVASDEEDYSSDYEEYEESFESFHEEEDGSSNKDSNLLLTKPNELSKASFSCSSSGDATHSKNRLGRTTHDWSIGENVKVYWPEQNEWYYGQILLRQPIQCLIVYEDGDQVWENISQLHHDTRCHSHTGALHDGCDQTNNSSYQTLDESVIGKRVEVFWDEEDEWFEGKVEGFSAERGLFIVYEDGDREWRKAISPKKINFLSNAMTNASQKSSDEPERILYSRPYASQLEHPLFNVLIPKKYIPIAQHIGSVVQAKEYIEYCVHSTFRSEVFPKPYGKSDSITQTDITNFSTVEIAE